VVPAALRTLGSRGKVLAMLAELVKWGRRTDRRGTNYPGSMKYFLQVHAATLRRPPPLLGR